ncbi:MAG TPA: universal stress protein [Chitinophagaceae bacterium]|nr:universal stress protein [Chitinophagaceae bacterium]
MMKNILIATDFSQAGHNACLYGIELAAAFNARVILFSAYQQLPVPVSEAPVILTQENMSGYVKEQLVQEAAVINRGGAVELETVCMEGLVATGILATARKYEVDIIIAGMKDRGKGFRKLFGSTVTSLARRSHVPVIVVPVNVPYTEISAIALATENDIDPDTDTHSLESLGEIGSKFNSRLYLVRVAENSYREAFEERNKPVWLKSKLRTLAPEYKCISGKAVPEALNEFVMGYHIKMLALLPHQHSLVESWFVKSATRAIIFETNIPLLILPNSRSNREN